VLAVENKCVKYILLLKKDQPLSSEVITDYSVRTF